MVIELPCPLTPRDGASGLPRGMLKMQTPGLPPDPPMGADINISPGDSKSITFILGVTGLDHSICVIIQPLTHALIYS